MNQITLQPITETNIEECLKLEVTEEQKQFVASPAKSLAYAYVSHDICQPFGIYLEGRMAGYILCCFDVEVQRYDIWHFLIDKSYQNQGVGRQVLKLVCDFFALQPFGKSEVVILACHEKNKISLRFYQNNGFKETGEKINENRIVFIKNIFEK